MTKLVLYLLAFVLIVGVAKAVMRILMKGFADLVTPTPPDASGPRPRTQSVPTSEALKKDPVCGTFIAPSTAVQKSVGGQTYYFCSKECRDRFNAA